MRMAAPTTTVDATVAAVLPYCMERTKHEREVETTQTEAGTGLYTHTASDFALLDKQYLLALLSRPVLG